MTKDELFESLRKHMLEELHLEDVTEEDITPDTQLFNEDEGLGLDSLDAVELVTLIEKHYGVEIEEPKEVRQHFASMDTLTSFILASLPASK